MRARFLSARFLAFTAELFHPAGENGVGSGFDVEEFEAHADSGFDDADYGEGFDALAFALQGYADTGSYGEGLASADENATKGDVRGDAVGADAGFQIEDFRVSSERKTNGIAAVAEAYFLRLTIGGSVVHEN
jgi:hypothetical protein